MTHTIQKFTEGIVIMTITIIMTHKNFEGIGVKAMSHIEWFKLSI